MSKKSELLKLLDKIVDNVKVAASELENIEKNNDLTPEGKSSQVKLLKERLQGNIKPISEQACAIIQDGIDSFKKDSEKIIVDKMSDAGYQIGLNNFITFINSKQEITADYFEAALKVYSNDFMALSMIKDAVMNRENAAQLIEKIPRDNREYNEKLLKDLFGNLSRITESVNAYGDNSVNMISMDLMATGYVDFVQTRLDDELRLL
jgi:hypothetical protein